MGKAYIDIAVPAVELALDLPSNCHIIGDGGGRIRLTISSPELPEPNEDGSLQVVGAVITIESRTWEFKPIDG